MSLFAISKRPDIIAAMAAAEAEEAVATAEAWARDTAALNLAQEVAEEIDAPLDDVWFSLCNIPPNLYGLLESPEGWSALAAHMACDLGRGPVSYLPVVH